MKETADLVLAIFGACMIWTTSVIGGMLWLSSKFRGLEQTIYKESMRLRKEYEGRLYSHDTRIQRLEIRAFGFSGGNGAADKDDGRTLPK